MICNEPWIIIDNASKILKRKYVLSHINVTFKQGRIYGIVGPNGSGKTMLLRAIAGFLYLSEGRVIYRQEKPSMGVIIENPGFLPQYTGYDNLLFLAQVKKEIGQKQIRDAMVAVGLDPDDKRKVKEYSLGMKQKLAISQAIMEKPQVLILDEPFRGLDGDSLMKAKKLFIDFNNQGGTIFIASHRYEDIKPLCHEVYTMKDGGMLERL